MLDNGEVIKVHPIHRPDVLTATFAIESKKWKTVPVWLTKLMNQTITNAEACSVKKIPIARVVDRSTREKFVIFRESDVLDLLVGDNG